MDTELQEVAAYMGAAKDILRRRHSGLSGEELDLEWNRWCLLVSGCPPDLSRSTSWTPGWPGGPQVTSSDGNPQPHELSRSQDYSSQSAPEPLSGGPNLALSHAMSSTMSTSSRFPSSTYWPTAAKRYTTDGPANRPSRKRPHPQIPDVSCEYAPHQYLMDNGLPVNRHPEHHRLSVTTAPIPDRPYQFDGSPTPSTPATALTDASTVPSEMVSLNGNFDSSYNDLSHKLGMFRVISNASNFSFSEDNSKASVDFPAEFDDNCLTAFAPSQQSDLITHGLALSPTSAINLSYESNSAYSSQFPTSTDATAMQKSPSSAGSESDSSTKSRTYRVRHQEHIRQAEKCKIASKADLSKDSVRMVRVESLDGSIQVKASIPRKAQSPRTQGPRQYCKYCQDHPEGFRGEHELQRHTSRAHPVTTRKFWICEDLHGDGTFLAKCKSCVQKKRYNADYNAAAHLRRAHFFPRKRGRKPKSEAEKRGGKGGGKDPPIEFLKANWIREVDETVPTSAPPMDDGNNDVAADDEHMEEPELSSSLDDQPLASLDDLSSDEFEMWPTDAFQYATADAANGFADPQCDFTTDVASDPSFFFDVPSSQHAFASSDLEVLRLEEPFRWQ